jgi:hypothetical protein
MDSNLNLARRLGGYPRPMRPPTFQGFLLASVLTVASTHALSCPLIAAQDMTLTCHVTYAGETQEIAICPTPEPYSHEAVNIGHRFLFKAVHVNDENRSPRIGIYVYFGDKQSPRLIQHIQIRPPYPKLQNGDSVDLIGEQHLYAGALERELIYRCVAGKKMP